MADETAAPSALLPPPSHADEVRARAADRVEYVERLASALAHELRNPLHVVRINLQLLAEDMGEAAPPGQRERVRRLLAEIGRADGIVRRFLDFVRRKRPNVRPGDVGAVLSGVLDLVEERAARDGVRILRDLGAGTPPAPIDADALHQAFLNVVLNALEAIPAGRRGTIRARVSRDGPRVVVEIHDDGVGVPREMRDRLFDPFKSTKPGGTGLGLAVTKAIVEAHGGGITCEDAAGGGTIFRIVLPGE